MNALHRRWLPLTSWLKRVFSILWRAWVKYEETDGEQRAASFAYYAFFALFPLMVVLIMICNSFVQGSEATYAVNRIIDQVKTYLPDNPKLSEEVDHAITGALKRPSRAGLAGAIASAVLAWSALRFFQSLVHGVNRAWGTKEYSWWRLPIKNLLMVVILASALFIGIVVPGIVLPVLKQEIQLVEEIYWDRSWEFGLDFSFMQNVFSCLKIVFSSLQFWLKYLIPPLVLFYGFSMFYKFAPQRRTLFREVWVGALFATVGLHLLQWLFSYYTRHIINFDMIYGTFGTVIALLMWIYLSGAIIILGGCICAARYEVNMQLCDQAEPNRAR